MTKRSDACISEDVKFGKKSMLGWQFCKQCIIIPCAVFVRTISVFIFTLGDLLFGSFIHLLISIYLSMFMPKIRSVMLFKPKIPK